MGVGTATPTANLYVTGNIVSTTNVTSIGFANVGSLLINGTQLIDVNRNFTNVGTISSGIITSTQVALAGYKNVVYMRKIWGVGSRVGGNRTSIPYGIAESEGAMIGSNVFSAFSMITAATGSTRTYRAFMSYTIYGATSYGSFKIRCYFTDATSVDFTFTAGSGSSGIYQDGYSNEVSVSSSLNGYFVVRANPSIFSASAPFNIEIDYIEIQALDNY